MKKWVVLLLVAAVVSGVFVLSGSEDSAVEVTVATIQPQRVEQTVLCTGLVEVADTTPLVLPYSCVIEQVLVKEGQRVKEGDVLAVMDKEATRNLLVPEMAVSLAATDKEITAPADGVVMTVGAVEGQMLMEGTPCAVLVCDMDLQVRIAIPEKHLPDMEPGMTARITGSGFDKAVYTGTLNEIAAVAQMDAGGGTVVQGVVSLDLPDESMRVGLNARATVVTAVADTALVIPYEAVMTDDAGESVYLIQNGCAHKTALTGATQVANGYLVTDSRFDGATVALQPEKISKDGQAVREVTA